MTTTINNTSSMYYLLLMNLQKKKKFILTAKEMRNMFVPDLFLRSAVAIVNKVNKFPIAPNPIQMKYVVNVTLKNGTL